MFSVEHKVRVFVFQILQTEVEFLLLRHKPVTEWPLGPVVGTVGVAENMHDTVLRQVRADTGIRKPMHLIDLSQPVKELFGDIGLVEWPFAYQAGGPDRPVLQLEPGPSVGELQWCNFERAFRAVENPEDRDHLVKLRLHLQG
jgi:hypothetical protein